MRTQTVKRKLLGLTVIGALLISSSPAQADPVAALTDSANATASGGGPCPQLSGVTGQSSQIIRTFTWVNNGCQMPIRKGFYTRTGFGWDHINYRRIVDGQINHETTSYAQDLWGQALRLSGKIKSTGIFCHQKHYYTPAGAKRTMRVIISTTNYQQGKGYKGINTAYWLSGHVSITNC